MRATRIWIPILLLALSFPCAIGDENCSDGILDKDICCVALCGTCGGSGCSSRVPELGGDGCCGANIRSSGRSCDDNDAPCVLNGDSPSPTPSSTCENGFPGIQASDICCSEGCGTCGGSGCGNRGNGLTGDDCCGGMIRSSGDLCSDTGEAPCIIDESPSNTCDNGFPGIQTSEICCSEGCGTCGGSGCGNRGNGLTGADCCVTQIRDDGDSCSDSGEAPCIIGDSPSPTPSSTCDNGFPGIQASDLCCSEGCGTCGGSGCGNRGNGLTGADCCGGMIRSNGDLCSDTGEAPCIIGTAPTPTPPTPTPTPPTPTPPSPTPNSFDPVMPPSASTPVETIPKSCGSSKSSMRYAESSGVNGRLYMEDGGCATMTDLYDFRSETDGTPKGPIYVLDSNNNPITTATTPTGKWLLTSELHVLRGSVFYCRGKDSNGDCDELRIQSTGSDDFHEVRGHGGSLYFRDTIVTSWDTPNKKVQEDYEGGRSFINCVTEYESSETCVGQPKNDFGWCRMDIIDSEMGHLGWFDSESYGLTWKVRGFCADKTNPEVFDTSDVYGDIKGSNIHHMYYGMYSYGHQGGVWTNNKMHDNFQYGFDPHDDSDYITIANNEVYNNVNHGIIASKRCNNLEIHNNEVYDGGAQAAGIFLHRSTDSCKVYDNYVHDMLDAGIAVMESFDSEIYDNEFKNVKYGIRFSVGSSNNYVHDNIFDNCSKYGFYTYQGSDAPDTSNPVIADDYSDGRPGENYLYNNEVINTKQAMKIGRADNMEVVGNIFFGNDVFFEYIDSFANVWSGNSYPSDACHKNIDKDDPKSTFAVASNLPPLC